MFLDIEATNLKADFGYCLCIAWKWEGEKKIHCLAITDSPTFEEDPTNDKWLIEEFSKEAEKADVVVFHYGSIFDYPYLQTRALYHGLKPLARVKAIDTWRIARKALALSSNRLASLTRLLGVEEKTPLDGPTWVKAMAGHKPSIKYVVEHCKQDVKVLEQVYHKIKPLRTVASPKIGLGQNCPACGSSSTQRRGKERTVLKEQWRFSCNDCGHWFRLDAKKEAKAAA